VNKNRDMKKTDAMKKKMNCFLEEFIRVLCIYISINNLYSSNIFEKGVDKNSD